MEENTSGVMTEEVEQEAAAPAQEETTGEPATNEGVGEAAEAGQQQEIPNEVWETSRKRADAKAKQRYDRMVTERFGHLVNPSTGDPIRSMDDYFAALDAQADIQRRQSLQQKGIDPKILDDAINNSPVIKQAKEAIQAQREADGQRQFNEQMRQITALDGEFRTLGDLRNAPEFDTFNQLVMSNVDMVSAFKAAFFDRLAAKKSAAATQAAINTAKSKDHMAPIGGGNDASDGLTDDIIAEYRKFNPKWTRDQIAAYHKKYGKDK
uniref:Scaffolding protein n=1 Tax=Ackermannviridae sp. ctkHJ36 TaxID=2825754 RepID=A0A8S5UK94_9CAUD|nr:MAG TPA: hypothetical protein [Ackermannviridae sp. ctkHJ36]